MTITTSQPMRVAHYEVIALLDSDSSVRRIWEAQKNDAPCSQEKQRTQNGEIENLDPG